MEDLAAKEPSDRPMRPSGGWIEIGTVVLRAGGQGVRLLAALIMGFLGLCLGFDAAFGLAMPDAALLKFYVELVAGAKSAAVVPVCEMEGDAVVIGVRIVLVAALLVAVWIINRGWHAMEEV
jgi:hypothetical protein